MRRKWTLFALASAAALAAGAAAFVQPGTTRWLETQTGEAAPVGQARALWNAALDVARPPLRLAADAAIRPRVDTPYAVNTFLHQEVEAAKRARQLQLIRDAGFGWIRQPFPWYDLEIQAKGDFIDRRNNPAKSAWDKYDNIVAPSGPTWVPSHVVGSTARSRRWPP